MKYLKKFEGLNKKTVDPNEIYVFDISDRYYHKERIYLIGKINIHDNDYAPKMSGYILNNSIYRKKGEIDSCFIKPQYWRSIRVATSDEKEIYNYYNNLNKYNL